MAKSLIDLVGNSPEARKLLKALSLREEAKAAFRASDTIIASLVASGKLGEAIPTKIGKFRIVDNFQDKAVVFRTTSFQRYSIEASK